MIDSNAALEAALRRIVSDNRKHRDEATRKMEQLAEDLLNEPIREDGDGPDEEEVDAGAVDGSDRQPEPKGT